MRQAARLLIGERDFGAFGQSPQGTADGASTVRSVFRSEWCEDAPLLIYRVEANAFLQHMVRRIVGMLVMVGRGVMPLEKFEAIFASAHIPAGVPLAPPQGLVLEQVKYPGCTCPPFEIQTG